MKKTYENNHYEQPVIIKCSPLLKARAALVADSLGLHLSEFVRIAILNEIYRWEQK